MEHIREIVENIETLLPAGWKKVILRGIILPGSYEFEYYVKEESDNYKQNYEYVEAGILTEREMHNVFRKLRKISNKMLEEAEDKWNSYVLVIDKDYHFSIDYNYDDEISIGNEWVEKYK